MEKILQIFVDKKVLLVEEKSIPIIETVLHVHDLSFHFFIARIAAGS
jgi:hypothetical protein